MVDDLRAKLTEALKSSPNHVWLILPGPTDITPSFVDALFPVVRAHLAAAWDDGWITGHDDRATGQTVPTRNPHRGAP